MRFGAVELDHRFHGLGDGDGLRDVLFLDHLHARDLLQRLGGDGMRLVPAEVVARTDIDDADGELGGVGQWLAAGREAGDTGRCPLQEAAARNLAVSSCSCDLPLDAAKCG